MSTSGVTVASLLAPDAEVVNRVDAFRSRAAGSRMARSDDDLALPRNAQLMAPTFG
jgi:hypothetical protein